MSQGFWNDADDAAISFFCKVLKAKGFENNTVFSPYGLQRLLTPVYDFTENAKIHRDLETVIIRDDGSLRNTKYGDLMVALLKNGEPNLDSPVPNDVVVTRDPGEAARRKEQFQQDVFGSVMDRSQPKEGLSLYSGVNFQAKWMQPFDKDATKPRDFDLKVPGGFLSSFFSNKIKVETMGGEFGGVGSLQTRDYDLVAFPGKSDTLVYFIKPKKDPEVILKRLPSILRQDLEVIQLIFQMPKVSLKDDLCLLPLITQFDSLKGEFYLERLTPNYSFYVDDVMQKTELDLNEEEAKAKAFTGIFMGTIVNAPLEPPKPRVIKMDSPYFVLIRDKNQEGAWRTVFTSWIADPRK